jgi:uncharacterized protein
MGAQALPDVRREAQVIAGTASAHAVQAYLEEQVIDHADTAAELSREQGGFIALARYKLTTDPIEPVTATLASLGETLPMMLLGMALFHLGFFNGNWPERQMKRLIGWPLALGTAMTAGFIALAWQRHFPPALMIGGMAYFLAPAHLLMALGYDALLVRAVPRLAPTPLGQHLIAAGRMAFTNYIAMTVVMTFIFSGWGMGLIGQVPPHRQWPFILLGWALMLGWSAPWLARFRQGPLEWLWRSLTQGERLPFRQPVSLQGTP